ncbi:unnamed protein product [Ostreobium quekettii]|uniref:Cux N-terminal domain-containing protein n=1 Tax=Ostreobium quekettii TaxID=121088 RepID=A0A8S1JBE4_9CHLO|nr:unnamed protein product [Ostreobium quekettii]
MESVGVDTGSRETNTPLQMVYNFWREFGLESLRPKLDELGLKIAEYQEESMQNRRRLAEVTREFRRKADDAVVRGVGDLLKQYQQEVDKLTKRAKHGETAFLDLYQKMYEAPDPTPAVSTALESASRILQLEAEVRQTAHELGEYQAESKELKNQELTIRRLEDKIRSLESQLGDKIKELEAARRDANAGAEAEMRDREARLAIQLEESQANLEAMRKLHLASQNQVFSIQSQTEEERAGYRAELDIAAAEMERMQTRALALESEMQHLVSELDGVKSGKERLAGGEEGPGSVTERVPTLDEQLQLELNQQRQQLSQMKAELDASEKQIEDYKQSTAGRLKGLKDALDAKDQYARSLESELATRLTAQQVDDLTRQIQLLQAVQYSSEVDTADGEDGAANSTSKLGAGSLERILLQKSRHLEHELTKAKLSRADLEQRLSSAETTIANLHRELDENRGLVTRLEEDLVAQSCQVSDDRKPVHGDGASLPGFGQVCFSDEVNKDMTHPAPLWSRHQ